MDFACKSFDELTLRELHDLLKLRFDVFILEQRSLYPDIDGLDPASQHLLGVEDGRIVACARWWEAEEDADGAVRLGRIVVGPGHRGGGSGARLVREALERIGDRPVRIHGQEHLARFYESFGFRTEAGPFDEDGIPHLVMLRPAPGGKTPTARP
jgi:ElaA protein